MKIVSYQFKNKPMNYRLGFMLENDIVDANQAYKAMLLSEGDVERVQVANVNMPPETEDFFKLGSFGLDNLKRTYSFILSNPVEDVTYSRAEVVLGPPVPNPSKIICIGKNYKDHVAEMKSSIPEYPVLFAKFTNALIGPEDEIEKSPQTNKLDYEVELAVVIGKEAKRVKKENAIDYIAGYTIGNDISARDLQKRTPQWLQGKTLDRSTPIGPYIVTTDELTDSANIHLKSYVNGELRQSSNTKHLIFDIPYLIEFISNLITLQPGDIILTGTPDGVGFAMDPPRFLEGGDVVTLEIEGIGTLENRVAEQKT